MSNIIEVAIKSIPQNTINFFDIILAILTLLIAFSTTCILWKQHSIEKKRLKHELYYRLLKVYYDLDEFLFKIIKKGVLTSSEIYEFNKKIKCSKFLFKRETQDYLIDIYRKSLRCYKIQLKLYNEDGSVNIHRGPQRHEYSREKGDLLIWLSKQHEQAIKKFEKYFDLK